MERPPLWHLSPNLLKSPVSIPDLSSKPSPLMDSSLEWCQTLEQRALSRYHNPVKCQWKWTLQIPMISYAKTGSRIESSASSAPVTEVKKRTSPCVELLTMLVPLMEGLILKKTKCQKQRSYLWRTFTLVTSCRQ